MSERKIGLKDTAIWFSVSTILLVPLLMKGFKLIPAGTIWSVVWPTAFALAIVGALFTTQGAQFKIYFASVRKELFRIIWPSKQETLSTGMVVVVAMVVMTIIILLLDWLSTGFISYLIGS